MGVSLALDACCAGVLQRWKDCKEILLTDNNFFSLQLGALHILATDYIAQQSNFDLTLPEWPMPYLIVPDFR